MSGVILGPNGKPISSESIKRHAAGAGGAPVLGESFGPWAGRDLQFINLPGGGVVQFDLSKLTVSDFRMMRSHYQINSSLSVLSFMIHQLDWHIQCDDPKITEHVTQNMGAIWTRLVRAMSMSLWAGYAPSVLQWENDIQGRTVQLTKVKDLAPEEASINWKLVDGTIPAGSDNINRVAPKLRIFDGIKQAGSPWVVPVSNSYWYPLLMEEGDYSGRKLLKSAFQPWFFSTLLHLFSNRYFERFGEPLPVGRAPLGDSVTVGDRVVDSTDFMGNILMQIRSRAAVVLPSDRSNDSTGNSTDNFDYDIEYLESQMRGADFERYMSRLDEEMSLALFTPLLLMRTADVGSYNLGVSHMQMYLWQLNAIADDWAEYINKYIIAGMAIYNFGPNAKLPKIVFHKMGKTQAETNKAIIVELVKNGAVKIDLVELGQSIGLEITEVEQLIATDSQPLDPIIDPTVAA